MYSDKGHHIRHRVQLPGGKRIDIVYGDHRHTPAVTPTGTPAVAPAGTPAAGARAANGAGVADPLHICFHCAGELVYPLDWIEEGPRNWRIVLRCPDCEARREGVFEQATVEALDEELDRAVGALLSDLKQLTRANMTEEVEFFARALEADLIVPSDF